MDSPESAPKVRVLVVSAPNAGHVARPVVRVLTVDGMPIREPYDVGLRDPEDQRKIIVEVDV